MKLPLKAAFTAVAMLFPFSSAMAAPTYLSCELPTSAGVAQVFNFALDATAGTFGVYVPSTGSQRTANGIFTGGKASLNEGTVAWEIDIGKRTIIRDKRMVGEKDRGTCKTISAGQSGF